MSDAVSLCVGLEFMVRCWGGLSGPSSLLDPSHFQPGPNHSMLGSPPPSGSILGSHPTLNMQRSDTVQPPRADGLVLGCGSSHAPHVPVFALNHVRRKTQQPVFAAAKQTSKSSTRIVGVRISLRYRVFQVFSTHSAPVSSRVKATKGWNERSK